MDPNAIAQWAHDIRNTLGAVALYLEALERPSEADTVRMLARSDALLRKATSMCADLLREAGESGKRAPRRIFDVTRTIEEVVGLIAPIVPTATTLRLASSSPVYVTADPKDVFRILFNLIHNAVGVARTTGALRRIAVALEPNDATIIIRIADDGPGLPDDVRERLFRRGRSATGGSGYGLAIARELAERNGAVLELSDSAHGTEFTIELQRADPAAGFKPGGASAAL
jgi:signal transduction histidine kinase